MASNERNLRNLSDRELNCLRREVLAEEIRRIEEDPKAFVVPASAAIEEDLKILDTILDRANLTK
jgi:ribosome-binding ATPase YchF (GTP1/OBG family)